MLTDAQLDTILSRELRATKHQSHLTPEAEGDVIILAAEGESTDRGSTTGPSTMLMSASRCSGAMIAHPGLDS